MSTHECSNPLKSKHGPSDIIIIAAIAALTLFVYSEVRTFEFLSYDDNVHITLNTHVTTGLNAGNIGWAFTHSHDGNWYPLTLLTYMATVQFFGLNPGAHHIVGLIIHVINSVLSFVLFNRMTGARWRAAFIALLFAVHPMHVESVAWISERKDVLSVFFGFLAILVYTYYAERPSVMKYAGVMLLFILGLMSKPMLVTLPFVLLLLDFWPLGRKGIKRLLAEKIPFILVSAVDAVITIQAQKSWGAVVSLDYLPLKTRLENIPVSYVKYIMKMFVPGNLAFFYPIADTYPYWQVGVSLIVLAVISGFAVVMARRRPYVLTGWFWYIGTLVPVIGVVQVGLQSMADRYTYLPYVGLFAIAAMALPGKMFRTASGKAIVSIAAAAVIILCAVRAKAQVNYWQNSFTLCNHAIEVDEDNYMAYYGLGTAYSLEGKINEAAATLKKSILIKPTYAKSYVNMGMVMLFQLQRPEEAIAYFNKAIELSKLNANAYNGAGASIAMLKRPCDAIPYFNRALELNPDMQEARDNLNIALRECGVKQ
ncbi:MAG: tetratricopeptide repeat protein [Nitrospirae bacterium]|nr:tetratricopeptide repeat protein [Nitrospirota bacterium]